MPEHATGESIRSGRDVPVKYETRDQTVRVERFPPEPDDPSEFEVKVSPVANGWWTRAELTALRDKLTRVLEEE